MGGRQNGKLSKRMRVAPVALAPHEAANKRPSPDFTKASEERKPITQVFTYIVIAGRLGCVCISVVGKEGTCTYKGGLIRADPRDG